MKPFSLLLLLATFLCARSGLGEENWPQFRGPDGQGHSDERGLPLIWSETNNVKWKTAIHGRAWSSPVIWGKQIWLTTATEDGQQLFAVCVDRDTGGILRDLKVFTVEQQPDIRKFNTYASPTPVLEEGRVYVTFGSPGTACLDTTSGQVLWERRDLECNHFRGPGSSPILFRDLVIMNFDGSDHQFIVALNKQTGKTVWRKERSIDYKDLGADGLPQGEGDFRKAFSTPHIAIFDDKPMLISQGAKAVYGYEPLTGKEFWRVEERTCHSASSRPVAGLGMIFIPSGWSQGQLLAVRPGWNGDVLDANSSPASNGAAGLQLRWKVKRTVSRKPSVTLVGPLLYMLEDDAGIVTCLEANTGQEVWRERIGGNYSASPLYAQGRLYCFSHEGKTTVLATGRQFNKLAESQLGDGFKASPAVSGQALFLRSQTHLYRIENLPSPPDK